MQKYLYFPKLPSLFGKMSVGRGVFAFIVQVMSPKSDVYFIIMYTPVYLQIVFHLR